MVGRSDSTGLLHEAGPAPGQRQGWRRLPPWPRQARTPRQHRHRFQSLFIHKHIQSSRTSESNPSRNHLQTNSAAESIPLQKKNRTYSTPASSYFRFLQSKAQLPPACRPEEPKEGRLPSRQDRVPKAAEGERWAEAEHTSRLAPYHLAVLGPTALPGSLCPGRR